MSTIKSSSEHLILNADGAAKEIKLQANGVEKAKVTSTGIDVTGSVTATSFSGDGSALTGISAGANTSLSNLTATGEDKIASVWCDYNGQTNTINASYNVSSITDNGTGTHTVNFTTALSGSKYPVALSGIDWGDYYMLGVQGDSKSGSACKCVFDIFNQLGGAFHDPQEATFIAFGDGT